MKISLKPFIFFLFINFFPILAIAQCPDYLVLSTQEAVDNYATNYGCNVLEGSLKIDGPINNLDGLSILDTIYGSLRIKDTEITTDFTGLDSLVHIGGSLTIEDNELLTEANAFPNLESVVGSISFDDNHSLSAINGFDSLSYLNGGLNIYENDALISLGGFHSLIEIGGNFNIDNHNIQEINALSNLEYVGGNYRINASSITNLSSLHKVVNIGGSLLLLANSFPNLQDFSNLLFTGDDLSIKFNELLTNLEGLSSLQGIGGTLSIVENELLISLDGLDVLTSLGGLEIKDNPLLVNVNSLSTVTSITENLLIQNNVSLNDISGLNGINSVGGTFEILNNPLLEECCLLLDILDVDSIYLNENAPSCSDFGILDSICPYFGCEGKMILGSQLAVNNFPINNACEVFDGSIIIAGSDIVDLTPLAGLHTITGSLTIRNIATSNLQGLDDLTTINDSLIIVADSLETVEDFSHLTTLGSLYIEGTQISNFWGFQNLLEIGGSVTLKDMSLLEDFIYLQQVEKIDGDLTFEGQMPEFIGEFDSLRTIKGRLILNQSNANVLLGFNKLENLRKLIVRDSEVTLIRGFEILRALDQFRVIDNLALELISGFDSIRYIGALQSIKSPSLALVSAFENLSLVGTIKFDGGQSIHLDWMSQICSVIEDVEVKGIFSNVQGMANIGSIGGNCIVNLLNDLPEDQCCYLQCVTNGVRGYIDFCNLEASCNTTFIESTCTNDCSNGMIELNAKVLLEGAYDNNGMMKTLLVDEIPLKQPYDIEPYFYEGLEKLESIPEEMVDWILVEIRLGDPYEKTERSTYTVETQAGILLEDGTILGADGTPMTINSICEGGTYHIAIRHRNHLDIISNLAVVANDGTLTYDFTSGVETVYGFNQQRLLDGHAMMFTGDYNQDGVIQVTDYDLWSQDPAQIGVYEPTDGTLDAVVQLTDYDAWFANKAKLGTNELNYTEVCPLDEECKIFGMHYIFEPNNERYLANFDIETGEVTDITQTPYDFSYSVNTPPVIYKGDYYIMNWENSYIFKFNIETGEIKDSIVLDYTQPVGQLIMNPVDGKIYGIHYVTQPNNERYLVEFNLEDGTFMNLTEEPADYTYNWNTDPIIKDDKYYVMTWGPMLQYDLNTGILEDTIYFNTKVEQIILNPSDNEIYGLEYIEPNNECYFVRLDLEAGTTTRLSNTPYNLTYSINPGTYVCNDFYYVIGVGHIFYKFNVNTGELVEQIPISQTFFGAAKVRCR